ncbi:MAG: hypothetical protein CMJ55_04675 [Planctomycetaceae bacterium]|nr:hypothetical protein [Planctomycetaceae bacterium]
MLRFVPHLLILFTVNIYAQLYDNEFFQQEHILQNSIVLTFKPDASCRYDVTISVWPPAINISGEGVGTVLFYEAPHYIDMERMSVHRKEDLVHIVLPKRMAKLDHIPSDAKVAKMVYIEVDPQEQLSQLL